jgi:hypothetical protein
MDNGNLSISNSRQTDIQLGHYKCGCCCPDILFLPVSTGQQVGWRAYEVLRLQAILQISLLYLVGALGIGGHSRWSGARLLWRAIPIGSHSVFEVW